ncbi:MAG: hypothetical protein DRI92_06500 [Aquificota bacterium]|nr:MAG: hypothetical protein DRI92_06500 [Aquificota bacterium]
MIKLTIIAGLIKKYRTYIVLFFITSFAYFPISYTIAGWDQYYYFWGAKSILQNHTYLVDGNPPQYPMGLSLLIVPFFYLFGISELSAILPCIISGALVVVLLFDFANRMFDLRTALFASIVMMFSYNWWLSTTIRSDVPALLFIMLSIFAMVKYVRSGRRTFIYAFYTFAGFACLLRYTSLLIFPIMISYIVFSKKWFIFKNKDVWLGILLFLVVISPQMIYNHFSFGWALETGYGASVPERVEHVHTPKTSEIFNLMLILLSGFSTPVFPFFVYGIWSLFKEEKWEELSLLISWFAVVFALVTLYICIDIRYFYPALPPILLIAGYGFSDIYDKARNRGNLMKIIVLLIIVLLITPTACFMFDNVRRRSVEGALMKDVFIWVGKNSSPNDVVLCCECWEAPKYYSGRDIYSLTLPRDEIKRLISGNKTFLIVHQAWKDSMWRKENGMSAEAMRHAFDMIEYINKTYELTHVNSFELSYKPLPFSAIIFDVGNKMDFVLLRPLYDDRWDIYTVFPEEIT